MREAPASAIMIMVNCMETWPSGLMKPRDRVSMAITVPSVMVLAPPKPKLCMPDRPAHAPRIAVMTYSR